MIPGNDFGNDFKIEDLQHSETSEGHGYTAELESDFPRLKLSGSQGMAYRGSVKVRIKGQNVAAEAKYGTIALQLDLVLKLFHELADFHSVHILGTSR